MALRCIAVGRERHHVFLIVEFDGPHVSVDAGDHVANALHRGGAHFGQKRMLNGFRKPDTHVIRNTRLAGRVDHARGKLRHEHARFEADAGFQPKETAGLQEFVQPVQDIEIHDPGHG